MLPAVLALVVALGYPLVRQVVLSFQEFGLAQQFGQPAEWVGLQNYRELVTDPYLWTVVVRSVAFCLANAVITMAIGVAVALLMRQMSKPVRLLVQSGLLLAWAMPVVAALTVWQWLFDTQYGVVNWLLTRLGGRYRGALLAARAGVLLLRRHRDRGLDERAVRRLHHVRRPDPGPRRAAGGRRDRRRRRLAAAPCRDPAVGPPRAARGRRCSR